MTNRFKRRSRFEVMYQILSLCRTYQPKTYIMFQCNLSYELLQKYLETLVDGNLLKIVRNNKDKEYFQTTEYGERFINEYEKLKSILEEARREITMRESRSIIAIQ